MAPVESMMIVGHEVEVDTLYCSSRDGLIEVWLLI